MNKQAVSGRLKLNILAARNIVGKKSSRNDASVLIRVDNVQVAKTKPRSKLAWNEEIEIKLNKAVEIEFSVVDKNDGLLAMSFFKLNDVKLQIGEGVRRFHSTGEGVG